MIQDIMKFDTESGKHYQFECKKCDSSLTVYEDEISCSIYEYDILSKELDIQSNKWLNKTEIDWNLEHPYVLNKYYPICFGSTFEDMKKIYLKIKKIIKFK